MSTDTPLSLKEFLFKHKVTEGSEEELKYAKAAYRKQYQKNYQDRYAHEKKRLKITLSSHEYDRLKEQAEAHGQKFAAFAREAMLAYLDQRFLVPDAQKVSDLEVALRKIGNNINQIAHHTNRIERLTYGNATQLRQNLEELEDTISQSMRQPPNILEAVAQAIQEKRSLVPQLEALLASTHSTSESKE